MGCDKHDNDQPIVEIMIYHSRAIWKVLQNQDNNQIDTTCAAAPSAVWHSSSAETA